MTHSVSFKFMATLLAVLMLLTCGVILAPCASAADLSKIVVTLDPGHGGSDPGNTSASAFGGREEAYYTYEFSSLVKARLEENGVTVYLTRTESENPSLADRAAIAAGHSSHVFLSIHTNSYSSASANGCEVLVPNNNYRPAIGQNSSACATVILNKIVAETGVRSRGLLLKDGSQKYEDGSTADYYGIIRYGKIQNIPLVMLVETSFASNEDNYLAQMATPEARETTANAIADGLMAYLRSADLPGVPETADGIVHVSNDELRYLNADGEQIGQAFDPTTYDEWSNTLTITTGEVATLADWGWAAFNADTFRYGYLINGELEFFDDTFALEAEDTVAEDIASTGAANGSRFLGLLDTSLLNAGTNTVQFGIVLDGGQLRVLREYTVFLEAEVETESAEESTTVEPEETTVEETTTVAEDTTEAILAEETTTSIEETTAPIEETAAPEGESTAAPAANGCKAFLPAAGLISLISIAGVACLKKRKE